MAEPVVVSAKDEMVCHGTGKNYHLFEDRGLQVHYGHLHLVVPETHVHFLAWPAQSAAGVQISLLMEAIPRGIPPLRCRTQHNEQHTCHGQRTSLWPHSTVRQLSRRTGRNLQLSIPVLSAEYGEHRFSCSLSSFVVYGGPLQKMTSTSPVCQILYHSHS